VGKGQGLRFKVEVLGRGEGFRDEGLGIRRCRVAKLAPRSGLGAAALVGVRKVSDGGVYADSPDLTGKQARHPSSSPHNHLLSRPGENPPPTAHGSHLNEIPCSSHVTPFV
jgi:hypothetical protein